MHQLNVILAIARKELSDHLRNGWIISVSIAFALFALLISLAGFGFTGKVGLSDEQNTLFSLISLAIYLVPLLGLLLGFDAIAGEQERGTLDLLRSYPFNSVLLIYGKWLGYISILSLSLTAGLAVPTVIAVIGGHHLTSWLTLLGCAIWMGTIFISIAIMLSILIMDRSYLIAINIVAWLFLAILFDIGVIGLFVYMEGNLPQGLLSSIFFFNPTSLFRLLAMTLLLDDAMINQLGLLHQLPSTLALSVALLIWAIIPISFAGWRITRLDR